MSELRVGSISNKVGTGPVDLSNQWSSRSVTRFDQSTNTIDLSNNVSSLTDLAVGNHTITWTNNFNSAIEQSSFVTGRYDTTNSNNGVPDCGIKRTSSVLTSSLSVSAQIAGSLTDFDCDIFNASTFGELA